jgi:glycosyltransferase involved in cell wall biosynthesis
MSWLPEQPGNGLDRVYHALYEHLPEVGVEVRGLIAGSGDVGPATGNVITAFAPDTAPLYRRLHAARQGVRHILRTGPVDLVASHFALYTAPALDLIGDRPLVVHFHGPWAAESAVEGASSMLVHAKRMMERMVYRRGTRFIVLSAAFRDVLVDTYRVPAKNVHIVPGGVDVSRFTTSVDRTRARHHLGWPTDRPLLLSVRRLARRMGLETLIEAVDKIRRSVPDVLLLIAGNGPLRSELQSLIEARDLTDNVRLLGYVPEADLPRAYRAADATVVPTHSLEGFGLITVESLAAGTPVFVTPRGGLPEVVRDLSPSLVFDGTSSSALAARLRAALQNDLPLPSAKACRAYAVSRYSWAAVAQQTRAVYEDVLTSCS